MSLAFRWTPFSSHPRSTSVFSFRPFPFHRLGIPISFIKNSLFRVYLSSQHRISAGLPRTAHLPSSVAEIYFNLPAVKACQFLPSPLISVLYNSIQSRPFVCLLRLFSSPSFLFLSSVLPCFLPSVSATTTTTTTTPSPHCLFLRALSRNQPSSPEYRFPSIYIQGDPYNAVSPSRAIPRAETSRICGIKFVCRKLSRRGNRSELRQSSTWISM